MGFEHLVDAVDHPYYKERPLLPRIVFIQGSSCKQFSPLTKTRVKVIQDRIGPYYVSPKDEKGIRKAHGIGIFSNKGEDQLTFVSGDQDEFLTRSSLREFWDPHLSPDAMCLYVNQTRAPDVPVNPCIWTSYIASTYFMSENNSLALADWSSQYLGLDTFFDAERIFIPIGSAINNIDPVTDRKLEDHAALIVISPIYKTVDYLDSSPTLTRSSGVETKVFEKVFHLLSHHLGRKFIWPDWRMRKLKAVVDTNRSGACVLYVLANVIGDESPLNFSNGGFDPYQDTDKDTVPIGQFAYEFGADDNGGRRLQDGFAKLEDHIIKALPQQVQNNKGEYAEVTKKEELRDKLTAFALDDDLTKMRIKRCLDNERHTLDDAIMLLEHLNDLLDRDKFSQDHLCRDFLKSPRQLEEELKKGTNLNHVILTPKPLKKRRRTYSMAEL